MISQNFIESWKAYAPWQELAMVEQDLIIKRALIEMYQTTIVNKALVFRGGTALNTLYLSPALRYSEDLDFVQLRAEPIGDTLNAIRDKLDTWLGEPLWKKTPQSVKLIYRYTSINNKPMRLKIEINTREHFQVQDLHYKIFSMNNEWYSGFATITTYSLEELMATKIRALFQRRKARDLFDVHQIFSEGQADLELSLAIFHRYCAHEGTQISGKIFEQNMKQKRAHKDFQTDMIKLLPATASNWDFEEAFEFVQKSIISKIP